MDLIAQFTTQNCPNFNGKDGDWSAHNVGVTPIFYTDKVTRKDKDGTETVLEIECVTLVVAGDDLTEASQPMDDQLRERFAAQYEAWKSGKEILAGTPITEWKAITARQAAFLEANNIFTVENLAQLSDYNVTNVPDGRALRDKAARWLRTTAAANVADENAKMKAQLAEMKAQIAALTKRKRPEMPQEQRDKVAARQRARHAEAKRGLAALKAMEAAAISNETDLPANETV